MRWREAAVHGRRMTLVDRPQRIRLVATRPLDELHVRHFAAAALAGRRQRAGREPHVTQRRREAGSARDGRGRGHGRVLSARPAPNQGTSHWVDRTDWFSTRNSARL